MTFETWYSGQNSEHIDEESARKAWDAATICEREACWFAINKHIVPGTLPGNGWDQSAQRNGMILAANLLQERYLSQEREARRRDIFLHDNAAQVKAAEDMICKQL